jgi:hypothetical protein
MVKDLIQNIQNYLDAVISSFFKTAQDGRKLFYPRGVWGGGYAIASEPDYKRVVRQIKGFWGVLLVLMTIGAVLQGYLGLFISGAFLLVFYFIVWAPYLVRGLQPSDEKLSLQESYTSQALGHSSARLWSWEITALALVGIGIVMLVVDTSNWLIALALIVIFGLCAAGVMWMLILRRRASHQEVPR